MHSNWLRHVRRPGLVAVALAGALALSTAMVTAEPPSPPPFYAIENVRVVTGTGTVLDDATVVLADGLIATVGANVATPADAWVIDGTDLTVYPAFIEGLSTLGQQPADDSGGGGGGSPFGGGGGPEIRGPEDRPRTTPWVSASDLLSDDGAGLEKWRKAGYGAAVTSPTDGLFAGQAAVIHLGHGEPSERVIANDVAQYLSFQTRSFREFPGSLMGVLSYLGQTISDTRHYSASQAIFAASPRGKNRPGYDRTLAPIATSLERGDRFLLPADSGREIDRALAMADRWDVPAAIYGAQGAYAKADRLAAADTPVIVDLDWPETSKDRDPDADQAFRDLYHQRMAPTGPATLEAAGVTFAFTAGELGSASEVMEKVRTAIDAGLSEEGALAGLTSGPAKIFGLDDRLGTIERGKIANLVLASGPPWAEDTEIAAVFVDGVRYAERTSDEPSEPPASDVSGTWEMTLQTPRGPRDMTAELEMSEDGKVTGEVTSEMGSSSVEEGKMSGDLLRFEVTREMGGRSMTAAYSLTVEGERADGAVSAGPMSMDIAGERTAKPEEGADEATGADDEPTVTLDELREVMAVYQGPARDLDTFAITNASVWTVSGETLENATVVVSNGKITAVGADVSVPDGAEVFDANGGHVIPGIIDAHSHIAGDGGLNEGSVSVSSMVAIGDVLDPDDIGIYRALAGGVTAANILHGSSNPIGGQNQVIKLRWGGDADDLRFEGAPPGIKFALGENPKRSNFRMFGMPQRYPQTRMGVMDVIREAFREAAAYRAEWDAYEAAKAGGANPMPPRWDAELEPLVEILEGERLVHSHSYRADEILQLLRLAEEHGFQIATLQHVLEGYKVADEIAAHGAGASTFSDWWGYKVEAYEAIPHAAALMHERGVLVSINSDSGEEMRHLNQEAAKAVKWGGVDEIDALAMVTLNPAKQLRIDDHVGSIEVGKDADLVVYDGHPLSIFSVVQHTFVDGDLYFDLQLDRERQSLVEAVEAKMNPPEDEDDEDDGDGSGASSDEPERIRYTEAVYSCREGF